jgi:hypothetical protein
MEAVKSYKLTEASTPPYTISDYIRVVSVDIHRYHQGNGDMWPITWGLDGNLYGGAGDNRLSPVNFWRIRGEPQLAAKSQQNAWFLDLVNNFPLDPVKYCRRPDVDPRMGIKPAGLLDIEGCVYFAVELQNYGTDPAFTRQENVCGWIITSWDYGRTWNEKATPMDFFTGRLSSVHFVQQGGPGYRNAPDTYVYAVFPCGRDGKSYWENGDCILLGRTPAGHIIDREYWEFYTGLDRGGSPVWEKDSVNAAEIFAYPGMCGENHITYNAGIGRYIMGNYSFLDDEGNPRPNHQGTWPDGAGRSQLSLYEAKNLWGPWNLFYQDDNWGFWGNYQPNFPEKWIYNAGKTMFMVSAGTYDDYNFTVQRIDIGLV